MRAAIALRALQDRGDLIQIMLRYAGWLYAQYGCPTEGRRHDQTDPR